MIVESFPVGLLACNCTILAPEAGGEAIVVDPGGDAPRILDALERHRLRVRAIAHTHAHIDHVGATQALKDATGAAVLLHPEDLFLYDNLEMQSRLLRLPPVTVPPIDGRLAEGLVLRFGGAAMDCLHTPGHTPGSTSFHLPGPLTGDDAGAGLLLSGDTLFLGGIGRTDLPGGSYPAIMESIHRKLLVLPDETRVIPGHGPPTTIGQEKRINPFLD